MFWMSAKSFCKISVFCTRKFFGFFWKKKSNIYRQRSRGCHKERKVTEKHDLFSQLLLLEFLRSTDPSCCAQVLTIEEWRTQLDRSSGQVWMGAGFTWKKRACALRKLIKGCTWKKHTKMSFLLHNEVILDCIGFTFVHLKSNDKK